MHMHKCFLQEPSHSVLYFKMANNPPIKIFCVLITTCRRFLYNERTSFVIKLPIFLPLEGQKSGWEHPGPFLFPAQQGSLPHGGPGVLIPLARYKEILMRCLSGKLKVKMYSTYRIKANVYKVCFTRFSLKITVLGSFYKFKVPEAEPGDRTSRLRVAAVHVYKGWHGIMV